MRDAFIDAAERDLLHSQQMIACVEAMTRNDFVKGSHFRRRPVVTNSGIELFPRQALVCETLAETEGSHKLDRFCGSDSGNQRDFLHGASAQAGEGTISLQKLASHLNCIGSRQTGPKQDRDQLGIGQRGGSTAKKFFTRPLVLRHLADFYLGHLKSAREGGGSLHGARQTYLVPCLSTKLLEQFPDASSNWARIGGWIGEVPPVTLCIANQFFPASTDAFNAHWANPFSVAL
jgi:hypothetical protein